MSKARRQSKVRVSATAATGTTLGDRDLQRASGFGRIVLRGSESGTEVVDLHQKFPIRIMLPRTHDGAVQEAVVVNAAGGIAGGDRLELEVIALGNAQVTVTSQAAEKIYRALDEPAQVATKLKVREAARLAWLPQEAIVFDAARFCRRTEIELCDGTELVALERLVFGRAAHGEEFANGFIRDQWLVKKDGRRIWFDSFRVAEETVLQLRSKAALSDYGTIATLLYFGRDLDCRLEMFRQVAQSLACDCAATTVAGLIVVRIAAHASSDLKVALIHMLKHLGREGDPALFRVPKMWSC
jgi:urease accessory protein